MNTEIQVDFPELAPIMHGVGSRYRRYTRDEIPGMVSKSPSRQPLMDRVNQRKPACSEQSVCRTSRYKVRKANDMQGFVRPHSTSEAWNLTKYLLSRGTDWDRWREGEEGDLPQDCLPHVIESEREPFCSNQKGVESAS